MHRFDVEVRGAPIRTEVDGLESAQALAIQSSGEIFIGDHNRVILFQVKRGDRAPVRTLQNGSFQTFWGLVLSLDEKTLFASSGAGTGGVYRLALPLDGTSPAPVWTSTRNKNQMIFMTIVR